MDNEFRNYAEALLSIAKDEGKVSEYLKEAQQIELSLEENPELMHLLSSAFLNQEEKEQAVRSVYQSISLDELKNFVLVVTKKGLAYRLDAILREFIRLANRELGIVQGTVYSSEKLGEDELASIANAVSEREGVKAELKNVVDPSLIGGFRIVLSGKEIDYSLEESLRRLSKSLKKGV